MTLCTCTFYSLCNIKPKRIRIRVIKHVAVIINSWDDWSINDTHRWLRGMGRGQRDNCFPIPPPEFWAVGKFSFHRIFFSPKIQKFGLKSPHFWWILSELKFWTPIISSVGNSHLPVGKLQLPVPRTFFNRRRRWRTLTAVAYSWASYDVSLWYRA